MASVFYKEILDARRHLEEWILRQSDYHPRILYPAKLSDKCKELKKDISKMGRTHSKKFLPCTLSQETTGRCASAKPGKKDKKEEEEIRSNAGRGQSNSQNDVPGHSWAAKPQSNQSRLGENDERYQKGHLWEKYQKWQKCLKLCLEKLLVSM